VDRPLLYATIKELLANEDGCIRGLVASVYPMLSPEDAKALLPEIVKATHTTAPSGEMFAYGIPCAYRSHRPLAESLPCRYLLIHDLDTFPPPCRGHRRLDEPATAASDRVPPDRWRRRARFSATKAARMARWRAAP
jgi:hypothetical protein